MPFINDRPDHVKLAGAIVAGFDNHTLPYVPTSSSTGTNLLVLAVRAPSAPITWITVAPTGVPDMQKEILHLLESGYRFGIEDAYQTSSLWQDLLGKARHILVEQGRGGNPSPSEVVQAIIYAGNAFINQLDRDPRSKGISSIPRKLEAIGLKTSDGTLFDKYLDLNPFFNSTKHTDDAASEGRQTRLNGSEGWMIAMDYFECVRRIFLWYYDQKGSKPNWPELEPIDCTQFPLKYIFDLSKRW